jgi:predicted esterase
MEINKHNFTTDKTARYFTSGKRSEKTKNIWIVCHGYGQLAESFIKKFESIADDENHVVAPEGLHRYYLDEKHERVGASWMTKEERLDDINDYVHLLDKVLDMETSEFNGKIILLGFSQGVATASRWYTMGKIKPAVFILWAGVFPPDLPFEKEHGKFEASMNFVVIGNQDEYFNLSRKEQVLKEIREKGIKFEVLTFEGKHVINSAILEQLKKLI